MYKQREVKTKLRTDRSKKKYKDVKSELKTDKYKHREVKSEKNKKILRETGRE